jgi:hypothetical protein
MNHRACRDKCGVQQEPDSIENSAVRGIRSLFGCVELVYLQVVLK